MLEVLVYSLIPVGAMMLGVAITFVRVPGAAVRSAIQHFTAGIVFAAVATELLPELDEGAHDAGLIIGFLVGVGLMLLVKKLSEGHEDEDEEGEPNRKSLVVAVGIDLLVDGLLVGVSLAAGAKGWVLVGALTLEVLFLGLSTTVSLQRTGATRKSLLLTMLGFAGLLLAGSLGGAGILSGVQSSFVHTFVIAFAAAALLYLVTEELLVEAHEERDTAWVTATFFFGFLLVLMVERLV